MMDCLITVTGGSRAQRSLVTEAAAFYLSRLIDSRKRYYLDAASIEIALQKDISETEDSKGDCCYDGDEDDSVDFFIRLDSTMNRFALLRCLAHEMIHVEQYIKGYLKETSIAWNISIWKGKRIDSMKLDYYDHPWELDAYGREHGLLDKFVQAKKYRNALWYRKDPDFL